MRLLLIRDTFYEDTTLGTLQLGLPPALRVYQTLEDTERRVDLDPARKVWGRTAIPRGVYRVILGYASRFDRVVPRLLDVPGFDGILIHPGNTAADTAGCILVGEARDGATILRSREAFLDLMGVLGPVWLREEPMTIEIRGEKRE